MGKLKKNNGKVKYLIEMGNYTNLALSREEMGRTATCRALIGYNWLRRHVACVGSLDELASGAMGDSRSHRLLQLLVHSWELQETHVECSLVLRWCARDALGRRSEKLDARGARLFAADVASSDLLRWLAWLGFMAQLNKFFCV